MTIFYSSIHWFCLLNLSGDALYTTHKQFWEKKWGGKKFSDTMKRFFRNSVTVGSDSWKLHSSSEGWHGRSQLECHKTFLHHCSDSKVTVSTSCLLRKWTIAVHSATLISNNSHFSLPVVTKKVFVIYLSHCLLDWFNEQTNEGQCCGCMQVSTTDSSSLTDYASSSTSVTPIKKFSRPQFGWV